MPGPPQLASILQTVCSLHACGLLLDFSRLNASRRGTAVSFGCVSEVCFGKRKKKGKGADAVEFGTVSIRPASRVCTRDGEMEVEGARPVNGGHRKKPVPCVSA